MENYLWIGFLGILAIYCMSVWWVLKEDKNTKICLALLQVLFCLSWIKIINPESFYQVFAIITGFMACSYFAWSLVKFCDNVTIHITINPNLKQEMYFKVFLVYLLCLSLVFAFIINIIACSKRNSCLWYLGLLGDIFAILFYILFCVNNILSLATNKIRPSDDFKDFKLCQNI